MSRSPCRLEPSESLREILSHHVVFQAWITTTPSVPIRGFGFPERVIKLPLESLNATEETLTISLSDEVLSAFAARGTGAALGGLASIEDVGTLTEAARAEGLPRAYIAIARKQDEFLALRKKSKTGADVLAWFVPKSASLESITLTDFLSDALESSIQGVLRSADDQASLVAAAKKVVVHYEISDEIRPITTNKLRVKHAKFGLGSIEEKLEGTKVRVKFDNGKTVTLDSSFVSPA